jgi:hypothetical protein
MREEGREKGRPIERPRSVADGVFPVSPCYLPRPRPMLNLTLPQISA